MAYFPPSNSVVAYQIVPSSLLTGASIIGRPPVAVTNTPSISGAVDISNVPQTSVHGNVGVTNFPANQSVSGTVVVAFPTNQNVSGSVIAFQGGAWTPSVSGTVGASVIGLPPVRVSDGSETLDVYEENQADASVTGLAILFKSNVSSSIMSVPSPSTPLPVIGSVSGSVGIVGNPSISGTVLVGGTP